MRVTLFDYGAGNLHSLAKAIAGPGVELRIEEDPFAAIDTDVFVLPGVGAFAPAAARLAPARNAVRHAVGLGLRCLGVCLGMQLIFDHSEEGEGTGLGIFDGRVRLLRGDPIPQIGWNTLEWEREPPAVDASLREAYYANSYVCEPDDASLVAAWTVHDGDRFPAVVHRDNVLGVQFHPEKSSAAGVRFIRTWIEGGSR